RRRGGRRSRRGRRRLPVGGRGRLLPIGLLPIRLRLRVGVLPVRRRLPVALGLVLPRRLLALRVLGRLLLAVLQLTPERGRDDDGQRGAGARQMQGAHASMVAKLVSAFEPPPVPGTCTGKTP